MFSASISTIVSVRRSTVPLLSVGEDDFDQLDVDQGMERCPVFLERAVPDSLIGTSRRPRSPKRTPNRPEPTASRQRRTSRDSIICRSFASHAAPMRLPENRGVPGSSPGLAIGKCLQNRRFLGTRSESAKGQEKADGLCWVRSCGANAQLTSACTSPGVHDAFRVLASRR
jgi:hypothetical protein